MKPLLLILLTLVISNTTLKAEPLTGQAKLDSLLAELPKAKGDTNEVKWLNSISYNYNSINPDKGIKYGLKGLKLAKKIKWTKGEADSYNSLGVNYISKSDIPKAIEYYQQALKLNEKIKYKIGIADNLGNIGLVYSNLSDYPKSLEYHSRALKINNEIGNKKNIAGNLSNIGNIYLAQSDYPKALDYYHRALKINNEIGNKDWIAVNLFNIANTHQSLSDFPSALEYLNKALKINNEIGNKKGRANVLSTFGAVYFEQSDYPKALEYFHRALSIYEELGYKIGIVGSLLNIGTIYKNQSDYPKALDYYHRALKINNEIGNKKAFASGLTNLGSLYYKLSKDTILSQIKSESKYVILNKEINLNKSIEYSLNALKISEEINSKGTMINIYYNLHNAYYDKGMYKQSIDAHRKYKELKDSIFSKENSEKIAALEKSREDDLKQKEIEKQKIRIAEQEKREQLILYFSIGFFIVMAIVMIVIYRLLKRSDKLLYNVLPVSIAKRLKKKEHPISDYFTQASIVFIDIVNFTELSQDADPRRVVEALNKIFTKYDAIANKYGLEKIKTIGDSYMAAAGIPEVQKDNTHRAAQMALEVKEMMKDYHTADGTKIEVRIGLDCGPVVAGVIGENKFIYDMWSDAVNTASRMESSSIAGQVHVSERFKEAVTEYEQFDYVERGEIEIKGKGKMKTFFMGSKLVEKV